ncbi:hypothetical protein WN982_40810 [Paraburkholderia sp. IMGN_8]|uniref:hypothetical protein n=1 Tax=Paraburkholderia sp. IMGN_8 TaxID=3136564 RepID=UPI003100B06F
MAKTQALPVIHISDLTENLEAVMEAASRQPVAVLNHDHRPVLCVVSPALMAQIAELHDRYELEALARSRLESVSRAVNIDVNDL